MGVFSGGTLALLCFFGSILLGIVGGVCGLIWWKMKKPSCFWRKRIISEVTETEEEEEEEEKKLPDLEKGETESLSNKSSKKADDENAELELRKVYHLSGPPRFLFTIKEESKEDMESDYGRRSRSKSLSEIDDFDTSSFSSLRKSFDSYGVNPLFESLTVEEINRLRSSPPPKLKFLRDAEDKRIRRMLIDEYDKRFRHESPVHLAQVLPLSSSPT